MKILICISACAVLLLSSCSFNEKACEDVNEIAIQALKCQVLQNDINSLRGGSNVLTRTELERRYEQNCLELRFSRDEMQPAICDNKAAIEKETKAYLVGHCLLEKEIIFTCICFSLLIYS